eukprot:TRINITY_DN17735_c0_g1_i1.p1 TRINITY_DN17735_c0_g1~~TRINITY_DN17735_c0_g1_i1.p1  ORF type:complete len:118 (+),score=2.21 TRINITY_DN17735_c0_g1_i1:146-499(+)
MLSIIHHPWHSLLIFKPKAVAYASSWCFTLVSYLVPVVLGTFPGATPTDSSDSSKLGFSFLHLGVSFDHLRENDSEKNGDDNQIGFVIHISYEKSNVNFSELSRRLLLGFLSLKRDA